MVKDSQQDVIDRPAPGAECFYYDFDRHTKSPDARYFRNSFSLYHPALKLGPEMAKAQDRLTSLSERSNWQPSHTQPKQSNDVVPDFDRSFGGHAAPLPLPAVPPPQPLPR